MLPWYAAPSVGSQASTTEPGVRLEDVYIDAAESGLQNAQQVTDAQILPIMVRRASSSPLRLQTAPTIKPRPDLRHWARPDSAQSGTCGAVDSSLGTTRQSSLSNVQNSIVAARLGYYQELIATDIS